MQFANVLDVVHSYCHCGCLWVIVCTVDADAGTLHQMLYSAQLPGCLQHGAVLHPGRHVQWVYAQMVLADCSFFSQGERHYTCLTKVPHGEYLYRDDAHEVQRITEATALSYKRNVHGLLYTLMPERYACCHCLSPTIDVLLESASILCAGS